MLSADNIEPLIGAGGALAAIAFVLRFLQILLDRDKTITERLDKDNQRLSDKITIVEGRLIESMLRERDCVANQLRLETMHEQAVTMLKSEIDRLRQLIDPDYKRREPNAG